MSFESDYNELVKIAQIAKSKFRGDIDVNEILSEVYVNTHADYSFQKAKNEVYNACRMLSWSTSVEFDTESNSEYKHKQIQDTERQCRKCGEVKPISMFEVDRLFWFGYFKSRLCKCCKNKYEQKRRQVLKSKGLPYYDKERANERVRANYKKQKETKKYSIQDLIKIKNAIIP